jgi:hypothetical protein
MNFNNTGTSLGQLLAVMLVCSLLAAPALSTEVTYADDAYSAGDTLMADDLNTQFNEIKSGINGNHSSTKINSTIIETNRTDISTNGTAIVTNGGRINDNSTDIEANRTSIIKSNADISRLTDKINARTTAAKPSSGDMQYWDGKAWVLVPAPSDTTVHSTLTFANGKPVWKAAFYNIGDRGPAGGFVFYVTDDGAHGLEAAPVDQSRGAAWGCAGTRINGGDDKAVGTGAQNTAEIIAGCRKDLIAARIADAYTLNGYDDWFLPSQAELNEMWLKLADSDGDGRNKGLADPNNLGGFTVNSYWSSSEVGGNIAWVQAFLSGSQIGGNKNKIESGMGHKYRVRAVRAF